jgi:hypothetical protein
VFICNRPLSAVLAALAAAAAFVLTDEVYREHLESMTETAEASAAPGHWLGGDTFATRGEPGISKPPAAQ